MAFSDYSTIPASNTIVGDDTFIGPNMPRDNVRPALQQFAADGRALSDQVSVLADFGVNTDPLLRAALAAPTGADLVGTPSGGTLDDDLAGIANIRARAASTAAALETLAATYNLTGYTGDTHVVETAPYITRDNLEIDLNGAVVENTNATALATNDYVSAALPLGTSSFAGDDNLTFHNVASIAGLKIQVGAGVGASFAAGDNVLMVGATSYAADIYTVYRNWLRARVVSVSGDFVTLDRAPSAQLAADTTVTIANASAGTDSGVTGVGDLYYLYRPHIHGGTIKSDVGPATMWGGVIDGHLHDLLFVGRNGISLNALQDCLIENIRFRSWRKICEIAQGSVDTVVRNVRGTLDDYTLHSDIGQSPFFIGINENCAGIALEDLVVSSGVNIASGNACQLAAGRDNEVRHSTLRFPAHTGVALSVQGNSAGNGITRCGYRNVRTVAPVCSIFLGIGGSGTIDTPYAEDCRFEGTPTTRAANIVGANGRLLRSYFESGNVQCTGTMTGWRIEGNEINGAFTFPATFTNNRVVGNYVKDGFTNLTGALLKTNVIADNESDASRRLNAAAIVVDTQAGPITTTAANAAYQTAVFAAGDLAVGDRIIIYSRLAAGGAGGGNRSAAVGVSTPTAGRKGCGSQLVTAAGSLNVEAELVIASNTSIIYHTTIGGTELGPSTVTVDSLAANALTVTVEAWISGTESITPYGCRIIPVKLGMKHLELR